MKSRYSYEVFYDSHNNYYTFVVKIVHLNDKDEKVSEEPIYIKINETPNFEFNFNKDL